jgi:hypothetical protein
LPAVMSGMNPQSHSCPWPPEQARHSSPSNELSKEARAQAAKAEEIANAVYDLKAVNPNCQGRREQADTGTAFGLH